MPTDYTLKTCLFAELCNEECFHALYLDIVTALADELLG